MIHPSRNINLDENGRGKRGGTAHVDASAMADTPQVMGIYDFTLENGNQFIIRALKDGKVYKNLATTIKTGLSVANYFSFETFDNELFICDGASTPQTWDGSAATTSDITSSPTDWAAGNNPQQMIKHGYGNSERMWAVGCPNTPNSVYASYDGDAKDFSDAHVITINIETGDGFGIIGAVEYGDRLMCFGKRKAYVIIDTDATTSNWGYVAAQWEGGAANHRLIIKTPNDIVCMMEDGEIYSVTSVQAYGDYKSASLTRPSFMHRWIKENVRLGYISHFHGVYDPAMRAIKIFVVRSGQTQCDIALVYFIDRPVDEAWMIHDNQGQSSGYNASSAAVVRKSAGSYKVYTGDYDGYLWELEKEDKNDNSIGYYAGFKTPLLTIDNPRSDKMFKRIWLSVKPQGDYSVYVKWWIDNTYQSQLTLSMSGNAGLLDSFILDTDKLGGGDVMDVVETLGNRGKRIQFEVYNSNADEDFYFAKAMIDYKQLGARPK